MARRILWSSLLLVIMACSQPQGATPPATADDDPSAGSDALPTDALRANVSEPETIPTESWACRNDLEVSCADGACEVAAEGELTPMSVHFDTTGALSVCAYSGCWEGTGEVTRSRRFLVWVGSDLVFSTSPDPASGRADIAIVLDREDSVATLKVGAYALPLLCQVS